MSKPKPKKAKPVVHSDNLRNAPITQAFMDNIVAIFKHLPPKKGSLRQ